MLFESRGGSKGSDREKLDRFFWEKGFELDFEDRLCQPLRGRDFGERMLPGSKRMGVKAEQVQKQRGPIGVGQKPRQGQQGFEDDTEASGQYLESKRKPGKGSGGNALLFFRQITGAAVWTMP